MEKHGEFSGQDNSLEEGTTSLSDLLTPLWHARWLIVGVTSLTVTLSLLGAVYLATYKSEGFLQFGGAIPVPREKTVKDRDRDSYSDSDSGREKDRRKDKDEEPSPGILLADYKRYAAAFSTSERFAEYVKQNKLEGTAGINGLRKAFASREGITKSVKPVYPFTKLDAKELMEQPRGSSNNVIGLRVSFDADSPGDAQQMVALLGNYTMDSIVYQIYSDALRFKHTEITEKITRLDNEIIDNKKKLEGFRRQGIMLKQIVAHYPDSASQAARQVVSVNEDSARFLSPITHLMATEVEALEANETIHKAKYEQQQSILLREYYDRAKALLDTSKSGKSVLLGLEPVKESVFKSKNLNDELVKEVYNMITIDNQNALSLYFEKSRFIAGPSLPERSSTRISIVLAMSFLLGLLGSVVLTLGRNWLRENRSKLTN